MEHEITIKKLRAISVAKHCQFPERNKLLAASMNAEMVRLGFIMSKDLYEAVASWDLATIGHFYNDVIGILKKMKGDDVEYKAMYPNFPKGVMEKDTFELYINAMLHYWTNGHWMPNNEELAREFAPENTKLIPLGVCTNPDYMKVFTTLLSSNASLSEHDKKIVEYFMNNYSGTQLVFPKEIPFKETLCIVAAHLIENDRSIENTVTNATDVLRIMTYLSDGDISLAANTKFKSLPKRKRRLLVAALEKVISEEDVARHKNKWVRAFHNLHVGDYAKMAPTVFKIAKKVRSGKKLITFNSRVEKALRQNKKDKVITILAERPGDFARRLDHVLRLGEVKHQNQVADAFEKTIEKVSTRVVCQLVGHFGNREAPVERVVFPKGRVTSAVLIPTHLPRLDKKTIARINGILKKELVDRAANRDSLGNVWIDPELKHCPIPMQQRSASEGLIQVARGTRLPMTNKNTLRFFIYWVGQDIDLAATIHDENFNMIEQISYTHLKSANYKSCHSGDIINAPNGAAEFIDITIDEAVKYGARYVVMNVLVFSGPTFAEHKTCYAGWMTRRDPNANAKFDPKTVEQKIDLRSNSKNAIPVIFDLVERKGIWCDLVTKGRPNWGRSAYRYGGNNVHTNRATIEQTVQSMVSLDNKPNLYDLFYAHAWSRGTMVEDREEADVVFAVSPGENVISPFDIDRINSEFLA